MTGTFHGTEIMMWMGDLVPIAKTSGHLGKVNADCTDVDVCADDDYLIATKYYFSRGFEHCATVRAKMDLDGGRHGHLSVRINRGQDGVTGTGDITG